MRNNNCLHYIHTNFLVERINMKKTAILIIAIAVIQLICMSLWSANHSIARPFTIGTKSAGSMEIQFRVPEFEIEQEIASGKVWDKIKVADSSYLIDEGLPQLPVMTTTIAIPYRGSVEIEVLDTHTKMIKHILPYPAQDGRTEDTPRLMSVNEAFYQGNEVYPQEVIRYSDPNILRDFRVITIQVNPFAWNPETKELEVREQIDFRLTFTERPGINEIDAPIEISSSFLKTYESSILNFRDIRSDIVVSNNPPRYLMIYGATTDQAALTLLADFAFWKKQKGADVRLVSTAVAGTSTTDIKAFIQNIYNDINSRPDFIVLIGDTTGSFQIPAWSASGGYSDYPYTHLAGGDILGDVFVGRISAESTAQLDILFSKIYFYEKNINVPTAQWLNKMLLVGDTQPSGQSTIYINKWIKEKGLMQNPDYTFTELYSGDPSPSDMNQAINQGVGFFNYRGYIGMSGWSPGSSLINGVKLPHTVIITCSTGNYSGGTGTTESFIRLGTASVPAGAVTSIGMYTSSTHTMPNNALNSGIFAGIFIHGMRTMGEALLNGRLYIHDAYNITRPAMVSSFAHWCNLMGDPTMEVFIGIPKTFATNAPANLPLGTNYLDLVIVDQNGSPVRGAAVTISQGNLIMGRAFTDADGNAYLFMNTALTAGSAIVTVSMHDFKPLQSTIQIDANGSLVASTSLIDDDNVGNSSGNGNFSANSGERLEVLFAVRNTTSAMISNVTGYAASASPYVNIINNSMDFSSIDTNQSNYSIIPVLVEIAPNCPHDTVIRFNMHLTDAQQNEYVIPNYLYVTDAYMGFVSYQISDGGNSQLDPGETADLIITVRNSGTVPVNDLYGQLITLNDLVRVEDNIGYFGNIQPGTQIASGADVFEIFGRTMMLPGMRIPMRLRLYNNAGFIQYVDFTLRTVTALSTDPLGPDDYGYIIYDMTDTSYEDCPTYQWIGIAPSEGGAGTALPISDVGSTSTEGDPVGAQPTAVVNLPFPFVFYGQSFDQITVCSNGFLAMGETNVATYRNMRLPGGGAGQGGAPSSCIAPFWDDLSTSGGGIYTWYDAANNYFVVQWHNLKNGYNQSSIETFQVILYNPVYYPTSTGDGPIKIQYHTFNNVDVGGTGTSMHGNYSTIGIQNQDQTIGLEYSFNNTYPAAAAPLSNQKALYITTAPIYYFSPNLVYESAYVVDSNNNVIEPNETVNLFVNLSNTGEELAESISATLTSASPYVTMINSVATYSDIDGQSIGANSTPFRFTVSADCPDQQQLPFVINITTDTNYWQRTFNLVVQKPALSYYSYFVNDYLGNNNGVADPGETVKLVVNVKNTSFVDAHSLSAMLTSTLLGVTVNNPLIEKAVVSPDEIMQFVYEVTLDAAIPANSNLPFNFILNSVDAPTVTQSISFACGTSGLVLDFESSNAGFVSLSGWAHGAPEQVTPYSGNNLWATNLTGQYENNAMYILKTPVITLGTDAMLTFWHYLSCQNYYDGGNVSISTDGGVSFALLTPTGGYNTTLNIYSLGENGYTNLVNWSQAAFNLSAYAGQDVVLRWRFASNGTVQGTGWFIDNVMISGFFITPGMVTGNVEIGSNYDLSMVKLKTDSNIVSNPDDAGAYAMYLPQGDYTLTAMLAYHLEQSSPRFVLTEQEPSYEYDFNLDYLSGPSMLEYSAAAGDSIIHLNWIAPQQGTYPVQGYRVYRRFADYPFDMVAETTVTSYSEELETIGVYSYYVSPVYSVGEGAPSNLVLVAFPFTGNPDGPTPVFVNFLSPNYPNPFNPTTTISFSVAKAGSVKLSIYNTKGQLVKTLVNDVKAAGQHRIVWNGLNNNNRPVSTGMYLYKLEAPGYTKTRKMMMLK
jgi:hypothetical protein